MGFIELELAGQPALVAVSAIQCVERTREGQTRIRLACGGMDVLTAAPYESVVRLIRACLSELSK